MDAVALAWAKRLAKANTLKHNPSYTRQIPSGWTRAGENVAMGFATIKSTHAAWMKSPGHRANILGKFTHVGVAFIKVNGRSWAVEVFGKYSTGYGSTSTSAIPVSPLSQYAVTEYAGSTITSRFALAA
jgi:uncharacterized protein YkwD